MRVLVGRKLPVAEEETDTSGLANQTAVPVAAVGWAANSGVAAAAAGAAVAAAAGKSCLSLQSVGCLQGIVQTTVAVEAAESPSFDCSAHSVLGLSWRRLEPDWTACRTAVYSLALSCD